MCDKCFHEEFQEFNSEAEFLAFDKILSFKLINDKSLISKEVGVTTNANIYFDTFQCINCQEEWCLSIPDHAWRGFFLTKKHCTETLNAIQRSDKIRNIFGVLILLVLISMIISYCLT